MIKILGLGPGSEEYLTFGAVQELEKNQKIFLRTEKNPVVEFLKRKNIEYSTYDSFYEENGNFDDIFKNISDDLIKKYETYEDIVYAVPGHPLIGEKSVVNLIKTCKENNVEYKIIPSTSFIDLLMEKLYLDPTEGLKIIDAFDIKNQILDKRIGTIITQIYDVFIASEVKLRLLEFYNDETEIIYVKAAGIKGKESIRHIKLYELDMQEDIDYLISIYIPRDVSNKKDFNDLVQIIDILRSEDGCPWDKVQTHKSLRKAMIEEAYEVVDAIDREDDESMIEELGDVLLQVVFHAALGNDDGYFNMTDIIEGICNKMISRHPHVFGNEEHISTAEGVLGKWDDLKKKEKGYSNLIDEIKGITKGLPATLRAHKIQQKAKKIGFDFENVNEAVEKLKEEIKEVLDVYNMGNMDKIEEEVGDLLFSSVNVARLLKIDEEISLNKTVDKFIKRLSYIQQCARENNKVLEELTLDEMNKLWERSKNENKL